MTSPTRFSLGSDDPFTVTREGLGPLSGDQLRHPRFARPTRGVRLPADVPLDQTNHLRGVLLVSSDDAVTADVSAARLWSLPLPPWLIDEDVAAVAVKRGGNRSRRIGVRGRRLTIPDDHITVHRGIRVTTPERTWLDCAASMPPGYVLAMADALLRRSVASPGSLSDMVRWGAGRRGVRTARKAAAMADARAESPAESVVRFHIVESGLPTPVCNLNVIHRGEWLARADLAWPEWKVIVEYDGQHHLDEARRRHDAVRRNLLQDAGWLVIVLTGRDLHRMEPALQLIRSALHARGWRP